MIPSLIGSHRRYHFLWICISFLLLPSSSSAFLSNCRYCADTGMRATRQRRLNNKSLASSKQRQTQEDLNGILDSMGLTPAVGKKKRRVKVVSEGKAPTTKKKKSATKILNKREGPKASSTTLKRKPKGSKDISLKTQLDYARNGHAVLKNFVDPTQLKQIRKQVLKIAVQDELKAWRQKVQVASDSEELAASCHTVEDCQDRLESLGITASLPFLQYFNTWRRMECIKDLAYSLGEAASIILDVPTVRLYQDSLFWKRTGDGPTPWHIDARMAPFDTSHFVTFWIPLDPVPADGTGLLFCSKSHADVALPYWNPVVNGNDGSSSSKEWDRLEHRYPKRIIDYMPLEVGDVTVHSGWTLHSSNGNEHGNDRVALAISFVDAKAEIREDALDDDSIGDNEDAWGYQDWVREVPVRKTFKHHDLVPIVWPSIAR